MRLPAGEIEVDAMGVEMRRGGGIPAHDGLERRAVGTLAVWTAGVAWMVAALQGRYRAPGGLPPSLG